MDVEIASMHRNKTWHLIKLLPGCKAISTKWVYRVKTHPDGTLAKLRARLMARGFQQRQGIDFQATFAPVAKYNTLWILLALCSHHGWSIIHLDVKTAYLNGTLREEVYIYQSCGYVIPGKEGLVCKVTKAKYGLKQSGCCWYFNVDDTICHFGMIHSIADTNLYYLFDQGKVVILLLYVDDMYLRR
jgi:hypothetical protein